jgi:CRISPR-associated protein Csm3
MKLENIITLSGEIKLLSGLHIGGGDASMKIGGIDNEVIKHPVTGKPYIPGSSLKGKVRSLLEWRAGVVGYNDGNPTDIAADYDANEEVRQKALLIAKLFGNGKTIKDDTLAKQIGVTRVRFSDAMLRSDFEAKSLQELMEVKFENSIDRITSRASNPRQTERVPSGVVFNFEITLKQFEGDGDELLEMLKKGLRLLEMDALGGNGSRGYGRIKFQNLTQNGESIQESFEAIQPF